MARSTFELFGKRGLLEKGSFQSGVARGLLQGRPLRLLMGWGAGEELTKSWPTFERLRVQDLALAISYCFSPSIDQERIQNPAG